MGKGGGQGKKKPRKRTPNEKWKKYKIEGGKLVKGRFCPRCGPGIFLAISKNRTYCGKCSYTEFSEKK
ncbi:30S ribosomal protein S27ae [Nanoarchaeota archaeon]